MTKAKGNTEKAKKNMTLQMIGLTRSSSQEVADGYGPSIQKSELIADAQSQGYRIDSIRDIVEPATINLEERDLFNGVMAEAISLKKESRCDGLCFSRCDRLSRRFDAALQIALLRHARRYAGIWDWGGYELRNLVPARISEEQAGRILANLKRNREKSFGFGKRKWLTSRVICGLCGHRYNLRKKNGCACLRSDPILAQPPCHNVNIPWHRLSFAAWDTFIQCLTSFEALELCVKDKRRAWKAQKAKIKQQVKVLEEKINRLQQKRRQYSWQQAEGIITEEELRTACRQIQSEERIIREQLIRLEKFNREPAPPDMATFKKLAEYWTAGITGELYHAPDDVRARFAEMFDLHVTIHPNTSRDDYHFDLSANIPLEMERDKPSGYDIVFSPSRGGLRG